MILIIIGLISCRMSMFEMEDILYKLHLGWFDNVGEVEEVEEQEGGSTRKYKRWAGRNNYTLTQWLRHR